MADVYAELWKAIIRPPRDNYSIKDLGPRFLRTSHGNVYRDDIEILNTRGLILKCSWFVYQERSDQTINKTPVVVYMHGNCSSRLEALPCVPVLLSNNITLFCFDCAGSGQSGGEYVSLGFHEQNDLRTVVDFLRKSGKVSTIGLWGRSMGAVASIFYAHSDPSVAGMVLDSPFMDLRTVAEELADNFTLMKLPRFLFSPLLSLINHSIQSRAHFNIEALSPQKIVDSIHTPALFVAGIDDKFIKPHHCQRLFEKYAGDKNMILVEGDHNSIRPYRLQEAIVHFFHTRLVSIDIPIDNED